MNISKEFLESIRKLEIEYKLNEPLAPYTTFKIGGPADILATVDSTDKLVALIKLSKQYEIPFTMLGWGSNVLIRDKGIRGLVIKNLASNIQIKEGETAIKESLNEPIASRLDQVEESKYYSFEDLDYDESDRPVISVHIESGASLPATINKLIFNGITGLQWFGGIPGTIGGAIYNNIHGGTHYLSEYVDKVIALDLDSLEEVPFSNRECDFAYDYSRFHNKKEIILKGIFTLHKGDKEKAKYVYQEWTKRKKAQPQKSAGCVWQNISEEERLKLNLESSSWGYIIDRVLNLKGKTIGGAQISNKHAAFIENISSAKASDVEALMDLITKEAEKKLGIKPKSEIFILGER